MHIILFNGPPSSGKDTAANLISGKTTEHYKFAEPIDNAILGLLGEYSDQGRLFKEARLCPKMKEEKLFNGRSCRDLRIQMGEHYAKPLLGQNIFGELCARRISEFARQSTIIISDCGFQQEYDRFCQMVSEIDTEITLVKLMREGCSFDNDSRNYIDGLNAYTHNWYTVENNGSLEELKQKLEGLLFT